MNGPDAKQASDDLLELLYLAMEELTAKVDGLQKSVDLLTLQASTQGGRELAGMNPFFTSGEESPGCSLYSSGDEATESGHIVRVASRHLAFVELDSRRATLPLKIELLRGFDAESAQFEESLVGTTVTVTWDHKLEVAKEFLLHEDHGFFGAGKFA